VAYASEATNLVPGDWNNVSDVFVRDRQSGTTEWVSVGLPLFGVVDNVFLLPSISADGRCVAFSWTICDACNWYVFVRDRQSGTTELASVNSSGVRANSYSLNPSISADGRFVAFASLATNLVPGDTNVASDVFVRDRLAGTTERMSVDSGGLEGNGDSGGVFENGTSISADGRYVAFSSFADNLVPGDGNGQPDAFVRDRAHGGHASSCEPGLSGVIGCPCTNPPSGPERGCDNSSATGGASLSVSGGEYLSSDSLFVTTINENATALSIVLQGTISGSPGTIYGQGVRCVGGSLKRLYTKTASAGSITAPDFAAGDATVHARSAALGDAIPAGSTRWYMVLYRDSIVMGGCPGSSTVNTTQAREVTWLP
jgi:Tol biopolymer transport system component